MEASSSAINAPHQNEEPDSTKGADEADLFFGGEDEEATAEAQAGEQAAEADAAEPSAATEHPVESEDVLKAEREAKENAAAEDPTPPAGSAGPTETPATAEQGKKSGALEREYVVLHKVPLTKRALEHLLKEINDRGGDARVAYLAVEPRPVARNDRAALSEVYRKNRDSLGDEPTLVAVSARSFTERKVRPKQRPVEETLDIS